MTTFDGWDAPFCGDALALPRGRVSGDYLMHFRTKGSKNGIRRYQNEDGSWTPLGMRLRKEREGWGETRKERKAVKRVQRAEKRAEKAAARKARSAERTVRRNTNSGLDKLTDEELRRKIARAKMEAEYKEIRKSPLLKTGEKVVGMVLDSLGKKEERKLAWARIHLDQARIDADLEQAKERTKQAELQTRQAAEATKQREYEVEKMKEDRKAGLKLERKAGLKRVKKEYRESSAIGSFIKTHREAKLARIENRKEIRKGTAFVRSLIKSQNKIDRHNTWNDRTKLKFNPESYKGEYQDKQNRYNWQQQTKQANAHAEQARYQAEAARWAYEKEKLGGKKPGGKGGRKP